MSVKKVLALSHSGALMKGGVLQKRQRFGRCFSCMEISMEPGTLKDQDPDKLKMDIKRWAKAVVTYARQVSSRFGSSRG